MRQRRDRSGHRRDRQGGHAATRTARPAATGHPARGSSTARPPPTAPRRRSAAPARAPPQQSVSERVTGLDGRHHLPLQGLRLERRRQRLRRRPDASAPAPRDCFPASRRPPRSAASRRRRPCGSRRTAGSSWPRSRAASRSSTASGDTTPTTFANLRPEGEPQLGPRPARASRSTPTSRPSRSSTCSTPTTPRSAAPRPPGTTSAPTRRADHERLRGRARGSPGSRSQGNQTVGRRAGADRGLVPAGPDPHDRRPALRPDGALYVSAGDAASPDFVDYGQMGMPTNPCGDPPVGVGRHPDAADQRGRRAAQPGPPHARRTPPPSTAPSCA